MSSMPSQVDLQKVIVRQLTDPAEQLRWNDLVVEQHYLKSSSMVGEQIRYVAEFNGQWLACIGCSAATLKSALRSKFLKWTPAQEKQRQQLIIQNSRFLILNGVSVPNLASRCLSLLGKRISADWKETYGHPVYLLETFVEHGRDGTCYKACGWIELGDTKGYKRVPGGYEKHGQLKKYFVYPLRRDAQSILGSEKTPDDKPLNYLDLELLPLDSSEQKPSIHDILKKHFPRVKIPGKTGGGYPLDVIMGLILAGFICGIKDSHNISAWSRELSDKFKRLLRCPYKEKKGKFMYLAPSPNTIRNALQKVDPKILEQAMAEWAKLCGINSEKTVLALDGKVLCGAKTNTDRAPNHVTLYDVKSGVVIDQELVPNKTSEVTVARDIFERNSIAGSLITLDAAHTNPETANLITQKKKPMLSSSSKIINLHFSMPSKKPLSPPKTLEQT